jgi:mannose-6-phosphate isomerase-like protein (cupin superfamily)
MRTLSTHAHASGIILTIGIYLAASASAAQSTTADTTVNPAGYVLWSASTIDAAADRLEKSLGDKALVWETIGNYDGHSVYLVLRGQTSRAEIHDTESDVQISVRGKATSVIGGELVNEESLPRKQRRGTSIERGNHRELTPGDIMHIPPGAPHQLLIDPAEPYMYLLIKIDEEPLS